MSDYAFKLASLSEKKKKLLEEEELLIEKRKKEIGLLAENFGLLTLPDSILVGLFNEAESAVKSKDQSKLSEWGKNGDAFLKPKRNTKAAPAHTADAMAS